MLGVSGGGCVAGHLHCARATSIVAREASLLRCPPACRPTVPDSAQVIDLTPSKRINPVMFSCPPHTAATPGAPGRARELCYHFVCHSSLALSWLACPLVQLFVPAPQGSAPWLGAPFAPAFACSPAGRPRRPSAPSPACRTRQLAQTQPPGAGGPPPLPPGMVVRPPAASPRFVPPIHCQPQRLFLVFAVAQRLLPVAGPSPQIGLLSCPLVQPTCKHLPVCSRTQAARWELHQHLHHAAPCMGIRDRHRRLRRQLPGVAGVSCASSPQQPKRFSALRSMW